MVRNRFERYAPGGVPHSGAKSHPDRPVKIPCQRFEARGLSDGVGEDFRADRLQFITGETRIKGEQMDNPGRACLPAKIVLDLAAKACPFRIKQVSPEGYFQSDGHKVPV